MQVQKITQIGNSAGIIIPSELRKEMGLKKGSSVVVDIAPDKKTLIITKSGGRSAISSITPEFVRMVNGVSKRYSSVFSRLSKK